jgi:hypothetical protein
MTFTLLSPDEFRMTVNSVFSSAAAAPPPAAGAATATAAAAAETPNFFFHVLDELRQLEDGQFGNCFEDVSTCNCHGVLLKT